MQQDGSATGTVNVDLAVDHATGMRSYAAKAYYCNMPAKSNLKILTGVQVTVKTYHVHPITNQVHQVTKIHFDSSNSLIATGVQFSANSQSYFVGAHKQVVLSAGTVQTPHVLELSGKNIKTLYQLVVDIIVN
jgi:choline dehydrogenase-like flavoprotein